MLVLVRLKILITMMSVAIFLADAYSPKRVHQTLLDIHANFHVIYGRDISDILRVGISYSWQQNDKSRLL